MTSERKPSNNQFKQVFYHTLRVPEKYTETKMNEGDYRATTVWADPRKKRLAIDDMKCQSCGSGTNVEVHHLVYPEVWGEENVEKDLITLCHKCHQSVHAMDIRRREGEI